MNLKLKQGKTKFEKDTRVETLVNARNDYFGKIVGFNNENNLIRQIDYNNLTNSNEYVRLYYY